MRKCKRCGKQIPRQIIRDDGSIYYTHKRKYCLICIPPGHSSPIYPKRNKTKLLICTICKSKYKYSTRVGCTLKMCKVCTRRFATLKVKRKAVEYKGGKCELCGYNKYDGALAFHHKDPKNKNSIIARLKGKGWRSLMDELNKCILLCANCHSETHITERTKKTIKIIVGGAPSQDRTDVA